MCQTAQEDMILIEFLAQMKHEKFPCPSRCSQRLPPLPPVHLRSRVEAPLGQYHGRHVHGQVLAVQFKVQPSQHHRIQLPVDDVEVICHKGVRLVRASKRLLLGPQVVPARPILGRRRRVPLEVVAFDLRQVSPLSAYQSSSSNIPYHPNASTRRCLCPLPLFSG